MDQSPIVVTCHLTVTDLYLANLSHALRRSWWVWALVAILTVFAVLAITMSDGENRKTLILNFAPLLVFFVLGPLVIFGGLYISARSIMKQQKGLSQANRYTFSETGIDVQADKASGQMDWSYIFQALENKQFLFLYLSKGMRHVIPKRFFTDENDLARLRTLIRTRAKGKVRLLT